MYLPGVVLTHTWAAPLLNGGRRLRRRSSLILDVIDHVVEGWV
jgi:hypothetical protein